MASKIPCQQCLIIVGVIVCIVGFGISEVVIFTNGIKYLSSDTICKRFPTNLTNVEANKILSSQWNWAYKKENFNQGNTFTIKIQQKCPTATHDANVYLNGDLVARTDGKIITATSTVNINDCHGDTLFVFKTSDFGQVILNQNKVFVNKQIETTNHVILGYVKGKDFFINNDITILDIHGNTVAEITRNKLSLTWVWKFAIHDNHSPLADIRLLASIAGKQAFGEEDDKTDVCNNYFWYLAWTLIGCIILFVFTIILIFMDTIKSTYKKCFQQPVIGVNSSNLVGKDVKT